MVLLGDEARVKALLVELEIVLILTQDRCTFCAKHTIGSEIVLNVPDGTLGPTRLNSEVTWVMWNVI